MKNSVKNFIITAFIIAILATVFMIGDWIYNCWWHYLTIPIVAYFSMLFFKPKTTLLLRDVAIIVRNDMKNNVKNFIVTVAFVILTLTTVFMIGDWMYVGWWYYSTIPIVAYFIMLFFKPKTTLLLGVNVAIIMTYIPFFYLNMATPPSTGMLGIYHLKALPALAYGVAFGAFYTRKKYSELATFLIGLFISLSSFIGYLLLYVWVSGFI